MTKENRPHEEGGTRSGGPARILPVQTAFAPLPWREPCECDQAVLLRAIGTGELPLPDVALWRTLNDWIQSSAVARLRQVSHALAGEPYTGRDDGTDHWHRVAASSTHADLERLRATYDRPPRTPAQVQAEIRHSWARFERESS